MRKAQSGKGELQLQLQLKPIKMRSMNIRLFVNGLPENLKEKNFLHQALQFHTREITRRFGLKI